MNKWVFSVVAAAIIMGGILLYSCGGGNNAGSGSGTVGVYVTDDMSMYSQVTATIEKIQLVNTGPGTSCDLLAAPVTANIANLSNVMQLVDVTQCIAGSYNRFRLEFDKSVQLMSATGTTSDCFFTSFMDQGSGTQPKVLNCDASTGICTLDVNGAVNVLAMKDNKLALDFDLKNFDVKNFGMQNCSATMNVSPLTASQMRQHGMEAITGLVSNLNATNTTFDLTRGNRTFSVLYSGITASNQPGLDTLLQRAQDDGLRTRVTTSGIDLATNSITAVTIEVKVEGTVSNLTGTTFTLSYGTGGARNIIVDYSKAVVNGTLAEGSWANVKLPGYDQASTDFIADKVEIETAGMMTED